METFIKGIGLLVLGLLVIFVFAAISGFIVMLLWNWLVPVIFIGTPALITPTITWFQGWGIAAFSAILFKDSSSTSSKN